MYSISRTLYFIAILMGGIWAIGFFLYNAGDVIHVFLVISIMAILMRIVRGKDSKEKEY